MNINYTVNIDYGDRAQEGLTLPEALKALRAHSKLSRAKLCKRSGVSECNIRIIESGKTTPGLGTLNKLLIALGVDTVEVKYGMYTEPGRVMVNVYV